MNGKRQLNKIVNDSLFVTLEVDINTDKDKVENTEDNQ